VYETSWTGAGRSSVWELKSIDHSAAVTAMANEPVALAQYNSQLEIRRLAVPTRPFGDIQDLLETGSVGRRAEQDVPSTPFFLKLDM
jgi:hypothetical protein